MQWSARAPDKGGLPRPSSSAQPLMECRQVDDAQSRPAWLSPVSPQRQQAVVVWSCCWGGLTRGDRSKEAASHQVHLQDTPHLAESRLLGGMGGGGFGDLTVDLQVDTGVREWEGVLMQQKKCTRDPTCHSFALPGRLLQSPG